MAAGTKIFLAIAALFIGGIVLYYGVLTPPAEPTVQRDADTAPAANGDQPVEFRNELPAANAAAEQTEQRNSRNRVQNPPTVQDTLGRDETLRSWTPPRSPQQYTGFQPVSDGGKDTPDDGFVGPPMPADYQQRTLAANTPITTTTNAPATVNDLRIAAATRRLDTDPQLNRTATAPVDNTPIRYSKYSVRPGDTLVYIAEDWFGDPEKWDLIVDANPDLRNPNRLKVGQLLKLPPRNTVRTITTPAQSNGGGSYTVKSGDSLSTISWNVYGEGSAWKRIYDANRSAIGSNPDRLKVGMKLTIPKRES